MPWKKRRSTVFTFVNILNSFSLFSKCGRRRGGEGGRGKLLLPLLCVPQKRRRRQIFLFFQHTNPTSPPKKFKISFRHCGRKKGGGEGCSLSSKSVKPQPPFPLPLPPPKFMNPYPTPSLPTAAERILEEGGESCFGH